MTRPTYILPPGTLGLMSTSTIKISSCNEIPRQRTIHRFKEKRTDLYHCKPLFTLCMNHRYTQQQLGQPQPSSVARLHSYPSSPTPASSPQVNSDHTPLVQPITHTPKTPSDNIPVDITPTTNPDNLPSHSRLTRMLRALQH